MTLIIAEPEGAISRSFSLTAGSTLEDALSLASKEPEFAGRCGREMLVGIFGRVVQRNQVLQEGDRVELYRPLSEDPKAARRRRARSIRRS